MSELGAQYKLVSASITEGHSASLTYERYVDMQTIKLYERCLIACANYPEYWIRYVQRMDAEGKVESAVDALERASTVFVKVNFSASFVLG